ncbi:MAG: DHH family phosphoesterase [Lachnospiraceae bacterium]|nr:DHH family phosphoesterase [Lachnospiraceae bacterium]
MDLLKEIGDGKKIGISGHVRPDGDCIGSCLAVYNYLLKTVKDAELTLFLQAPADVFDFLPNRDKVNTSFVGINDFDVYIALDSGDTKRLGDAEPFFMKAKKKICIDHHESNGGYGDVSLVVPDASSTCEVLYTVMDKKYIDNDVAVCLYTGIIHDTGVLQYSNTSKLTLEIIGDLTEFDFEPSRIIDDTFYTKTYVQNQLLGRVLTESILIMDGKIIAGVVSQKMMKFYDAKPTDLEGIVNQLLYTRGVEVAIFMHEIRSTEYKVSMRSNGKVNVADIAVFFGGGGHARAAGCMMNGTYYDVLNNLTEHIEKQLVQ